MLNALLLDHFCGKHGKKDEAAVCAVLSPVYHRGQSGCPEAPAARLVSCALGGPGPV